MWEFQFYVKLSICCIYSIMVNCICYLILDFVFSSCEAICNEKSVATARYKVGMMLSLVQRVWCHGTFNRHNFRHVVDSFSDISRWTASIVSPSVSLSLH